MRSPAFTLAVLLALMATAGGAARSAQGGAPRVVDITAQRFEFWPSEIAVAQGEEVELRITSDDTLHGFRIVGAGTNVLVPKRGRGPVTVRFTGTTPGRYTFECSRLCGAGHNFMRGVLIVRAPGAGR
jgi:cytochrome c oxidase subunit 2